MNHEFELRELLEVYADDVEAGHYSCDSIIAINKAISVLVPLFDMNYALPSLPKPKLVYGDNTTIETPAQTLKARYALIEVDDLIASHNEYTFSHNVCYPLHCQQRDYSNDPSEQYKVSQGAKNLNPRFLLADTPTATDGAPIITSAGIVLGGNGRTMMIKRAMSEQNKWDEYKRAVSSNSYRTLQKFGLSEHDFLSFRNALVVRVVDADMNQCAFYSNVLNTDYKQSVDERTKTVSFARQISRETLQNIGSIFAESEAGTLKEFLQDDQLQRRLIKQLYNANIITPQNNTEFLDIKTGLLTTEGRLKLEGILLGLVLTEKKYIEAARSFTMYVLSSLPLFIQLQTFDTTWNILPQLKEVIMLEYQRRVSGMTKRQMLKQLETGNLMEQGINKRPDKLTELLWDMMVVGQKKFREGLKYYVQKAEDEINGNNMFMNSEFDSPYAVLMSISENIKSKKDEALRNRIAQKEIKKKFGFGEIHENENYSLADSKMSFEDLAYFDRDQQSRIDELNELCVKFEADVKKGLYSEEDRNVIEMEIGKVFALFGLPFYVHEFRTIATNTDNDVNKYIPFYQKLVARNVFQTEQYGAKNVRNYQSLSLKAYYDAKNTKNIYILHTYNRQQYRPETVYNELYEISPRGKVEKPIEKDDTLQRLKKMTEYIPYTGKMEIPLKDRERMITKDGTVNKAMLMKELLLGKLSVTQWQRFDSMRDHYEVIPKNEQATHVVSNDSSWWYYNRYKIISHSRHSFMSNDTIHMGDYHFNYVSPLPQFIPEYIEAQENNVSLVIAPDYIEEQEYETVTELTSEPSTTDNEKVQKEITSLLAEYAKKKEQWNYLLGNRKGAWSHPTESDAKRIDELSRIEHKIDSLRKELKSIELKETNVVEPEQMPLVMDEAPEQVPEQDIQPITTESNKYISEIQRLKNRIIELLPYSNDIEQKRAESAFRGVSQDPEKRGLYFRIDYATSIFSAIKEKETAVVERPDNKEKIEAAFERFLLMYKRAANDYLSSQGNVMSSFITGPANFPVERMRKRNQWAHNKMEAYINVRENLTKILGKLGKYADDEPIREGDENALRRAEEKLRKLEQKQKLMVEANKLIRKSYSLKETREVMEEKLRVLGLDENDMKTILYKGKISGFQDYELRNNNAEMKRMNDRVTRLRQLDSAKKSEQNLSKWTFIGGYVQVNYDVARYQVFFDAKPDYTLIEKMKKAGFRWTPSIGAWQSYLKTEYLRRLVGIVGDLIKVKEEKVSHGHEEQKDEVSNNSQSGSVKEPWELTEKEWTDLYDNSHPGNGSQSRVTRNSKSEMLSQMSTRMWLSYGVRDDLTTLLKRASLPVDDPNYKYMSPEEAQDVLFELSRPITYDLVIEKALKEGKPVPQHIVEEYNETKEKREALDGLGKCHVLWQDGDGEYEVEYNDGIEARDRSMNKEEIVEHCYGGSMNDGQNRVNKNLYDTYKPSEIMHVKPEELRLNNLETFLIKLNHPFRMLVWGLPGRGKSTLMLAMAEDLQLNEGKTLYVMTEEEISDGRMTERIEKANVNLSDEKVEFVDNHVLYNLRDKLRRDKEIRYVIIDSVNTFDAVEDRTVKENELIKLYKDFRNVSFIFIAHSTKDGRTYRGFEKLANMVDTVVPVVDKVATLSKHRDANNDQEMPVFSNHNQVNRKRKYSGAAFEHLERIR